MGGTDLRWFVERLRLITSEPRLPASERRRLFLEPRCHATWLPQDVPDDLIEEAWHLARMGPTSSDASPLRMVLLRSAAEKARLLPALDPGDRETSRLAPVVVVLAHDVAFWRQLHRLHPDVDAAAGFKDDPGLAGETAFRSGTLQAAYFIFAVRALGADIGAISGFDAAAVQAEFFRGTTLEVNFVCNIGYGDPADLKPRLPRLDFEEIVHRPAAGP